MKDLGSGSPGAVCWPRQPQIVDASKLLFESLVVRLVCRPVPLVPGPGGTDVAAACQLARPRLRVAPVPAACLPAS